MTPEARAEAAKYAREWRRKNPEKVRAIRERFWRKKAKAAQYSKSAEEEKVD